MTISSTVSYDELAENARRLGTEESTNDMIGNANLTFYVVVAALVVAVISTIVCSMRPTIIVLILVFVACLIAPIYFALGFPGAVTKDFKDAGATTIPDFSLMGSTTTTSGGTTSELSWGPGWGWILSVAAVVVAGIGLFVARPRAEPVEPWPEEAPKREVPKVAAPPPAKKIELRPKPGPEVIEERVYQHIKSRGGEIDVEECAEELDLTVDEVEAAIGALEKKGKLERE